MQTTLQYCMYAYYAIWCTLCQVNTQESRHAMIRCSHLQSGGSNGQLTRVVEWKTADYFGLSWKEASRTYAHTYMPTWLQRLENASNLRQAVVPSVGMCPRQAAVGSTTWHSWILRSTHAKLAKLTPHSSLVLLLIRCITISHWGALCSKVNVDLEMLAMLWYMYCKTGRILKNNGKCWQWPKLTFKCPLIFASMNCSLT